MRPAVPDDIDYSPEEVWDFSEPGFEYYDEEQMNRSDDVGEKPYAEHHDDFISAVKRKIYGSLEVDLPVHLLEDLEEVEMAEYEITSLEGIRFCKYAVSMDLSGNNINDISEIGECRRLEELYLSHNHISIIDAISNLGNLIQLDLSYNQIDDLSPLAGLKNLEYVNLVGNPVSKEQIEKMKKRGILVVN
jgi:internalin A